MHAWARVVRSNFENERLECEWNGQRSFISIILAMFVGARERCWHQHSTTSRQRLPVRGGGGGTPETLHP